jgi:alpha-mannosidase
MPLSRRLKAFLLRPQRGQPPVEPKRGRLYVVPIAHLDTQWRWTIRDTIARHLPKTLTQNAAAFARFPGYVLNLDGAFRYRLLEEYFPEDFERVKAWVAAGRWHPAGCFVDAADVNLPSPESLIRQILYGNGYFARTFGIRNRDVFLPDCFGFGFALPSIAAHCGMRGFSSQKLNRGRAAGGLPFALGRWQGPDGAEILAALDPGGYGELLSCDLSSDAASAGAVAAQLQRSGVAVALRYFGIGDTGGAPEGGSLRWLERSLENRGALEVRCGASGRLFEELTAAEQANLPLYRGELLMRLHGTGCYTSQAAMKRWNRQNERLADAAERAAVAAHWLGALPYPRQRLREAWERFLWHQFHDDLTGTSVPAAYTYSWNDECLSLNQFAGVLTAAVGAVARALDTRVEGEPLVVFNPCSWAREEVVELDLPASAQGLPVRALAALAVAGPDGLPVPAQVVRSPRGGPRLLLRARLPSCGFGVFALRQGASPPAFASDLACTPQRLENGRLRASFDSDGNLASLYDRALDRELLAAPLCFELLGDASLRFPAWEIRWADIAAPPREVVGGPAQIEIVEQGPVRVALEVRRRAGDSMFVERWSLAYDEPLLRLDCEVRWHTRGRLLKLAVRTALREPRATYDLGLGSIERGTNSAELYEVPAQAWADLSAGDGRGGVAIASDCKQGWDRPQPGTLRLTLLHTPAVGRRFRHQGRQDLGVHRFAIGLVPHAGDWRRAEIARWAEAMAQPMRAFRVAGSAGPLGKSWSLLTLTAAAGASAVAVRAIKLAEESDEAVVRLQELHGHASGALNVRVGGGVQAAREVNGAEEATTTATALAADGTLVTALGVYQPRTFALSLTVPGDRLQPPLASPVDLPFDLDVVSRNEDRADGDFDGRGHSLPGELLPAGLDLGGVPFRFGSATPGVANALGCRGQRLELAAGFRTLHLLAASAKGRARLLFTLDGLPRELEIAPWDGFVGQWGEALRRDEVAWVGTHRHARRGDEPYAFCYLYRYVLEIAATGSVLTLPVDERVRIMAMTLVATDDGRAESGIPLYD